MLSRAKHLSLGREMLRSVTLDDGQDQTRGVCGIMVDTVDGLHEILLGLRLNGSPGVGIAIKTREVRAGDLQADAVPHLEKVRGGPQIQAQFVNLPRLQHFRRGERLAITGTQDAIREDLRAAIGIHVDQFASEISITGRRGDIQHQ